MKNEIISVTNTKTNEQLSFKKPQDFFHELFGDLTIITNEDNEAFFLSSEVSDKLGYSANKTLLDRLDDTEKISLSYQDSMAVFPCHQIHQRGCQLLTEDGLYEAIFGSQKEEAKEFKKWVKEVLKSIRKTGSYGIVKYTPSCLIDDIDERVKVWKEERDYTLMLKETNQVLVTEIDDMKPKVEIYDNAFNDTDLIDIDTASDWTGIGKITLLEYWRQWKWICYSNKINVSSSYGEKMGYTYTHYNSTFYGDNVFINKKLFVYKKAIERTIIKLEKMNVTV